MHPALLKRDAGIVLVVAIGAVSAALGLGLLLALSGRLAVGSAAVRLAESAARLSAASGMEYAAARLLADPLPRHASDAASRCGDWMFRDGTGARLAEFGNPSYARSEPWIDVSAVPDGIDNDGDGVADEAGEVDRLCVPGEPFHDLDGDGRHSAWSGRLRGPWGSWGGRFRLRIGSPEGNVPLNAGTVAGPPFLDGIDNDGDGLVDEANEAAADVHSGAVGGRNGNGIPDHRDPEVPLHARIAGLVDGLCGVLEVPGRPGIALIEGRPAGGYQGWRDVELRLEEAGIARAARESLRARLDLGPYDGNVEGGWGWFQTEHTFVPISLFAVSPEMLEAHWRGLEGDRRTDSFTREPEALDLVNPHTGLPFGTSPSGPGLARMRIWPEESEALLGVALALRQTGTLPSAGAFLARAEPIFREEWEALASKPLFREDWVRDKAELAASRLSSAHFTLEPPVRFSVASEAGPAGLSGELRTEERLVLTTQEDFERMGGGWYLARMRGIRVVDEPTPAERRGCSPSAPFRPPVVSLPTWNWRGVTLARPPSSLFSRDGGSLSLGVVEGGLGAAQLYWPFAEDFDGQENLFVRPSWREYWPEWQVSPPVSWLIPPSDASRGYRLPAGAAGDGPYFMTCPPMGRFSLPGTTPPVSGGIWSYIRELTIEARLGPGGGWRLTKEGMSLCFIDLSSAAGTADDGTKGTRFTIDVRWMVKDPLFALGKKPRKGPISWLVRKLPGRAGFRTALVLQRVLVGSDEKTRFSLFVNGSNASDDGPMEFLFDGLQEPVGSASRTPSGIMFPGLEAWLALNAVDELRCYDRAVVPPAAEPERFLPAGTYTSPRYDPGSPTRLRRARWVGSVPQGFDADAIRAEGVGFDAAGSPVSSRSIPGGSGAGINLQALGFPSRVSSFRFKVHFDALSAPRPLLDAPVLDEISFAFQRAGIAPAWSEWTSR